MSVVSTTTEELKDWKKGTVFFVGKTIDSRYHHKDLRGRDWINGLGRFLEYNLEKYKFNKSYQTP